MYTFESRTLDSKVNWSGFGVAVNPPPRISGWTHAANGNIARKQGGFYYTSFAEWLDYYPVVEMLQSACDQRGPLWQLERDELAKFVCWRNLPVGCLQTTTGYPDTNNGDIGLFSKVMRYIMDLYLSRWHGSILDAIHDGSRTPLNKHKGYPDHTSNYYPLAINAHLSLTKAVLDRKEKFSTVVKALESASGLPMYCTEFARISGTSKWVTNYEWKEGWLQPKDERQHYWARTRVVMGQSFWHNVLGRRYMGVMKSLIRAQPQHDLSPEGQARRFKRFWEMATHYKCVMDSQDAKGFDQHVGYGIQAAAARIMPSWLSEHFPDYSEVIGTHCLEEVLMKFAIQPLLGPQLNLNYGAFLWDRKGVLSSGRCDTSVLGTLIRTTGVWIDMMKRSGYTLEQLGRSLGFEWDYMIWGDDAVIVFPERWGDSKGLVSGFEIAAVPGIAVFLAKNWMPDGKHYTLLSRMYVNTINREDRLEPTEDVVAVMGVKARMILLEQHPLSKLYRTAMMARTKTRRIFELAQRLSLQEIERKLAEHILEGKLSSDAIEGINQDMAELGWSNSVLSEAIRVAQGRTHAFGQWQLEKIDMNVTEAVNTLVKLGQEAVK